MSKIPLFPVPWAIEGGAQNSAVMARLLTWITTGGQEGVVGSLDCAVRQRQTPDGNIRVMPGAFIIINRRAARQSYIGGGDTETVIPITPNTSSTVTRRDLVFIRVINPNQAGGAEGGATVPNLATGPYVVIQVIENVSASTTSVHKLNLGYSAITLAMITLPPNTATVTDSMITPWRVLANPQTGVEPAPNVDPDDGAPSTGGSDGGTGTGDVVSSPTSKSFRKSLIGLGNVSSGHILLATTKSFVDWPDAAIWDTPVPKWATHVDIDVRLIGVKVSGADAWGEIRLLMGGQTISTREFDTPLQVSGKILSTILNVSADNVPVPASLRGKTNSSKLQAKFNTDSRVNGGSMRSNNTVVIRVEMEFRQKPQ